MNRILAVAFVSVWWVALFLIPSRPVEVRPTGVSFEEKLLAVVPEGAELHGVRFSPDGRSVAYVFREGERDALWVNGHRVDDSIVSGKGGPYVTFSGDSHLAYVSGEYGNVSVVVDGRRGGLFDWVVDLTPAPRGGRFAYCAQSWNDAFVIVDGRHVGGFDRCTAFVWSKDGGTLAFGARDEDRYFVVVDAGQPRMIEKATGVALSADGRHIMYDRMEAPGVCYADVDGHRQGPFELMYNWVFSPDGSRFGFVARKGGEDFVIVDGVVRGPGFDVVTDLAFSPDGTRVVYLGRKSGKWNVVLDGVPGPSFDVEAIWTPTFSPDGRHVAGVVLNGAGSRVMVDNRIMSEGSSGWITGLSYSPDGRHLAWVGGTMEGGTKLKRFMVIDERNGEVLDDVQAPAFSPDGRLLAYGARKGRELWWKVAALREDR